jgi:hypothetical protein
MRRLAVILGVAFALSGCATGQDVYLGEDVVAVIPPNKAIAYLQNSVRASHTGYECRVYSAGVSFPLRPGMPNNGVVPFGQLRARTVWAGFSNGSTALAVLAEGQVGLLGGDRCVLHVHPNPGPIGTRPPLDEGMTTTLEAIVSLGAQYTKPPVSNDGSLRVFMPVGI